MPDVHLGIGATVGSVIAMRGAVSPAAVGVDIGCGVAALRTDLVEADLEDLGTLRSAIEAVVPVGFHEDRKSTRLNSSHVAISYAVFCLKKKKKSVNIYVHIHI